MLKSEKCDRDDGDAIYNIMWSDLFLVRMLWICKVVKYIRLIEGEKERKVNKMDKLNG